MAKDKFVDRLKAIDELSKVNLVRYNISLKFIKMRAELKTTRASSITHYLQPNANGYSVRLSLHFQGET